MFIRSETIEILKRRAEQVLKSRNDTACSNISIFFEFIRENSVLQNILQELIEDDLTDFTILKPEVVRRQGFNFPTNQRDKSRVCLSALYHVMEGKEEPWQIIVGVTNLRDIDEMASVFIEQFFQPLYSYIIENLVKIDALLYRIIRYKAYSEWYIKNELYQTYNNNRRKGEENLDKKFRKFLFESGIDYPYSKPLSPAGETDVLTVIKEKPIPIELKIFTGDNKAHIRDGFTQALLYSRDYNSPIGYLVIFNVSQKELRFTLSSTEILQCINYDGKTIFLITINIYPHKEPASKRKLQVYEITEEYLTSKK